MVEDTGLRSNLVRRDIGTVDIVPGCGGQIFNIFNRLNVPLTKLELAYCVFPPGETAEEHRHLWTEEIYYVVSGTGSVRVDDESYRVEKGTSIALPVGVWHQMVNDSAELLCFVSVNSCPYDPQDVHHRGQAEPV
jgi:mannose-6-phosphate isomerase-like protein (cupin superfamily)